MTLWLYPQSRAKGKLSVLRDISLALRYLHQQEKTLVPADGLGSGGICRNAIGFFYDFFPFHGQFLGDLDHGQVFFGGSPLAAKGKNTQWWELPCTISAWRSSSRDPHEFTMFNLSFYTLHTPEWSIHSNLIQSWATPIWEKPLMPWLMMILRIDHKKDKTW